MPAAAQKAAKKVIARPAADPRDACIRDLEQRIRDLEKQVRELVRASAPFVRVALVVREKDPDQEIKRLNVLAGQLRRLRSAVEAVDPTAIPQVHHPVPDPDAGTEE